jgi:hypothetical protein
MTSFRKTFFKIASDTTAARASAWAAKWKRGADLNTRAPMESAPLANQYFGMEGSTWSAQASTPPVRFFTFWKPAWRKNSTALALRAPERQ